MLVPACPERGVAGGLAGELSSAGLLASSWQIEHYDVGESLGVNGGGTPD